MTARLSLNNLCKSFPGVKANEDVSFSVAPGEIHALLGENGAGKSTLVKMIYGVLQPDSGTMMFDGQAFSPEKPAQARETGVGMVFQHFSLFDALTVADNVALGIPAALAGRDLADRLHQLSTDYGLPLDPGAFVGDLSVGERQRVEIIRALMQSPSLLIMDEPTSVLTPQEVDGLFVTLQRLKSEGVSILYISHKLDEVRALCDHATILRRGRVVDTCVPSQETTTSLAERMIGENLNVVTRQAKAFGSVCLRVSDLSLPSKTSFGVGIERVSFDVRQGEILGIAGVAGNGQEALVEALLGERRAHGEIELDGQALSQVSVSGRRQAGLVGTPEERLGHAAVPNMDLVENLLLSARENADLAPSGRISRGVGEAYAEKVVADFDVRTPSIHVNAASLSGGNLQKYVVGRDVSQNPKAYVVSQPTWGVDAQAAQRIRQALVDLAAAGCAVVVISQDLDELLGLVDRIGALFEGRLSEVIDASEATPERLGQLMLGAAAHA